MRFRGDEGETLPEIVIAMLLLTVSGSALLAAITTAAASSKTHRDLATVDTVLRSFAEQAKLDVRTQCVPTAVAFPTYTLHQPPDLPAGYSVSPLGAGQPCPATKTVTPNTLPPVTLTVTEPDGTIKTLRVVLRAP